MTMCPHCAWPSMSIVAQQAVDVVGNMYWHSYCKECGTQATFFKKAKQED